MIETLERVDAWIYAAEKRAVAVMLSVMGLVVFLDVVYRVSSTDNSPLVPDFLELTAGRLAGPIWFGLIASFLAVLALRTRGETGPAAASTGLGIGGGLGVALLLYVKLLPSGLIWSQTLALALTLWMGMAGACLAAYQRRHLALDVGSKLWPAWLAPKVAAIGHFVTAGFCLLIFVLGVRSIFGFEAGGIHVPGHLDTWRESDGAAGVMMGTVIPNWFVMLSIPVGMGILTFRFALEGAKVWTGREKTGGDDTLRQLGIEDEVAS